MFETEWERPITVEEEDTCPECGGDWNTEGCEIGCPNFEERG